jgi:chromosome segregation ATPase
LTRQNLEIVETEDKADNLETSITQIAGKIALAEDARENEQNELEAATAHLKLARETADLMSSELAELNKNRRKPEMNAPRWKSSKPKSLQS